MKKQPIGFPKTISEFRKQFSTEEDCRTYLVKCRWPDGFICSCGNKKYWPKRNGKLFECRSCHKNHSPMSGTVMHGSHISLQNWFQTAYFVSTLTPGISALQLQRQLGLGSYRSAWFMLGRLRKAMVNENRQKLNGLIEVDEAHVGGRGRARPGRDSGFSRSQPHNKKMVAGAVEVRRVKLSSGKMKEIAGRIRLQIIETNNTESLQTFIADNVEAPSRIRTDGWKAYKNKEVLGNNTHLRKINDKGKRFNSQLPHVHRAFSNLKTWIKGTHHGVDAKYLQPYLDEFVFRFNRRRFPMVAFRTLLGISTHKPKTSLKKIRSRDASA